MTQPLFDQQFPDLDAIFEDFTFSVPSAHIRGRPYDAPKGYFFLGGLPGSVEIKSPRALYAKPLAHIADAVSRRCCNGSIGSFSAVRSAHWMKQGLLPVWAHDAHHIAHVLVGFVPYSEHERFAA